MPNSVEDTIAALEFEFLDEPTSKNSVRTSDGSIVRLSRKLWNTSPVLREHTAAELSYLVLCVPKSGLVSFLEAFEGGEFPSVFSSMLHVLATTIQLQLSEFKWKCLDVLIRLKNFDELDYPSEVSSETILKCFSALLDGPLRPIDIYRRQLKRIAEHCGRDRNVMSQAMTMVKKALEFFIPINLQGIPLGFNHFTVPVVVYKCGEKLEAAIVVGSELRPLNLFGNCSDSGNSATASSDPVKLADLEFYPHASDEKAMHGIQDSFFMRHGDYILYKGSSSVCFTSLQNGFHKEMLENCRTFLTRGNFAFALVRKSGSSCVLRWTTEERFVEIYRTDSVIDIDFDLVEQIMVISDDKCVQLYSLENNSLVFLQEHRCIKGTYSSVLLSEGRVYLWSTREAFGPVALAIHALSDISKHTVLENQPGELWNVIMIAGRAVLYDAGVCQFVENFPALDVKRDVLNEGECCALSELSMFY